MKDLAERIRHAGWRDGNEMVNAREHTEMLAAFVEKEAIEQEDIEDAAEGGSWNDSSSGESGN